jgi:hypothetical protein
MKAKESEREKRKLQIEFDRNMIDRPQEVPKERKEGKERKREERKGTERKGKERNGTEMK